MRVADESRGYERINGGNGMSDIEGSEPDWRSCKGSSEQVWATSEFQLREARLHVLRLSDL